MSSRRDGGRIILRVACVALAGALVWADRSPAEGGAGASTGGILGYVNSIPPESPAAWAERHRRVAARRAGLIIMVHRGARAAAPENTLEA